MINLEQVIENKFPDFASKPGFITKPVIQMLRLLFCEKEINSFFAQRQNIGSFEFVEEVLQYFDFGYSVSNIDKENIPPTGPVIIVANHPLGALDALAMIKLISEVRHDIKIVANDVLMQLKPMQPLLLPVDNIGNNTTRKDVAAIIKSLENGNAVLMFPAGEVSRVGPAGIQDGDWKKGFLNFAKCTNAPILPVFIDARNSSIFYGVSMLYKPLAMLLLVQEMFKQRSKMVKFKISEPIPVRNIDHHGVSVRTQVKLVKKHLYRISKNKPGIFATEKRIAHPESRQALKRELKQADFIGYTTDKKRIYICNAFPDSALLREIGRLRELSFRKVGEGSGSRRDLDRFDQYYHHLVLWDDDDLEIVGAYRIGEGRSIMKNVGAQGFYSNTLFDYSPTFDEKLADSIELGRSFVQPKYWGTRALDYLWQGIGAYLHKNPDVKYMFGPVSISNSYPASAKDLLVYYFGHFYGDVENLAVANNGYHIKKQESEELNALFSNKTVAQGYETLKQQLGYLNVTIPTLYKQYTDLCEYGGVRFMDFGVDMDFEHCIDGLILVETGKIREQKRKRYIDRHEVSAS